jgi:ABC-type microcin C transport system permease subunit YejE
MTEDTQTIGMLFLVLIAEMVLLDAFFQLQSALRRWMRKRRAQRTSYLKTRAFMQVEYRRCALTPHNHE